MRKVLFIALFLLGINNASMFGMAQEITLREMYSIGHCPNVSPEILQMFH